MSEIDDPSSPLTEAMVRGLLSTFHCETDPDIEDFIANKVFEFYRRGWSSVYFIVDEEKLRSGNLTLEAYFTLSHKAIILDDSVSKSQRKKIYGGILNDDPIAHFVLIGHLGKNIGSEYVSPVSATEILEYAFEIINNSKRFITFNSVLVECKKEEKLIKLYSDHEFKYLQEDDYVQLIRKV